jgi:hypothetical protein
MLYKRISDFPAKTVGTYTGNELLLISDTTYNAKIKSSELKQYILESASLLANSGKITIRANSQIDLSGSAVVTGDLTVLGVLNVTEIDEISITNLNVRDKTISVNVSGSDSTSTGSGLIVNGTDNVQLTSILFNPEKQSRWDIDGKEIVDVSSTQSLSNKSLDSLNATGNIIFSGSFSHIGQKRVGVVYQDGSSPVISTEFEYILVDSSDSTASLDTASGLDGIILNIKNTSAVDCMISASDGEFIDSDNSYTLKRNDSVQLLGSASNWYVFNYSSGNTIVII